ncbi:hypothetical protein ACUN9Y_09785 [Halomonas sp. V046]|uniref:hypothetical protein n=1 Tax=Halomonas sp. V046 TaxID=3459611 RepID=UPI0040444AF3
MQHRTIPVVHPEGGATTVLVEYEKAELAVSESLSVWQATHKRFTLPSGESLTLESAIRFENPDDLESYYVDDEREIEWLLHL